MSQDQDRFSSEEDVLAAMRTVWGANTMSAEDLEEFCPTAKVCKNVADLGIKGMDDEQSASTMRAQWKAQLERDGKLNPDAETIADLVAALDEPQR